MGYRINKLRLGDKFQTYGVNEIENFSKVNIFVGANNSGKSRFLRELFGMSGREFIPPESDIDIEKFKYIIVSFTNEVIGILEQNSLTGIANLYVKELEILKAEVQDIWVSEGTNLMKYFYTTYDLISALNSNSNISFNASIMRFGLDTGIIVDALKKVADEYQVKLSDLVIGELNYQIDFKPVYIPTIRGLRGYTDTVETGIDVYKERTKKDYFEEATKSLKILEIHTGLNLYDEITDLLLGNVQQRYNMQRFQEFLGKSFFDGQQVTLTPSRNSDVIKVKIGAEKEKNIYDLGDGIQSLIILTFPLFKYLNENLLLFIEEPELYLHPGMQRKFIEIFLDNEQFKQHQLFITTHSNHFLDMTLDKDKISVYKFSKALGDHSGDPTEEIDAEFTVDNVSNEDSSVLQELGVRNSAVLLSNCTIWVEGITDRFYIRRFLKVHPKFNELKEDIHYSFVEYSGGNITHWSFLDDETEVEEGHASMNAEKICSTLFLVSDKDGDTKRPRQEKLKKVLGERYYCLECVEIENVLSADTLKSVIAEYEKTTTLEHLNNPDFTQEDYKDVHLGNYINSLFNEGTRKRKGSYAAESGTVVNKLDFCKKAIEHITTYDDLSDEAKRLSQKLYNFIKKHNK